MKEAEENYENFDFGFMRLSTLDKNDVIEWRTKIFIRFRRGGDNINWVLVIEFDERYMSAIDERMEILKQHQEYEFLRLKHELEMSLSGLKIDLDHQKVYCDNQEISLMAKEYLEVC